MGKMERDINKLCMHFCPEGVDYYKLGELGKFYGGLTGKNKSDFSDGNAKFISYRNVYNNPALKLDVEDKVKISSNEKQNTLERGDIIFTGSSETADECGLSSVVTQDVNEKIYLNSFCFIFRFKNPKIILPDFSKHLFRSEYLRHQIGKTASGVTRFNVSKKLMANVTIPLPPLPIQQEIVRILDTFTNLTAELTAELTARRKQYEYYRDELLTFGEDVPRMTLKDISVSVSSGKNKEKEQEGMYPVYGSTGVIGRTNTAKYSKEQILVARVGANAGFVHKANGTYDVSDNTIIVELKDNYNLQYVYYILQKMNLRKYAKGGGQPLVTAGELKKIEIPIPDINEQDRVVSILDKFTGISTSFDSGLPAEIAARQKQYEYYRERLLSFKESHR